MNTPLTIFPHAPRPGPEPLDLLTALAAGETEIALLHSAANTGPSVLATRPLLTLEIPATGEPRWIRHAALTPPPLPAGVHPLAALQLALDAFPLSQKIPLI